MAYNIYHAPKAFDLSAYYDVIVSLGVTIALVVVLKFITEFLIGVTRFIINVMTKARRGRATLGHRKIEKPQFRNHKKIRQK
jgi:hypothetical protein